MRFMFFWSTNNIDGEGLIAQFELANRSTKTKAEPRTREANQTQAPQDLKPGIKAFRIQQRMASICMILWQEDFQKLVLPKVQGLHKFREAARRIDSPSALPLTPSRRLHVAV